MNLSTEQALQFAEAREMALIDWINGTLKPFLMARHHGQRAEQYLDDMMFTRIVLPRIAGMDFTVPDYAATEVVDALRLDGCDEFILSNFDQHYAFEIDHIWFMGVARHYRNIGHGSAITIDVAPAGTFPPED